MQDVRKNILSVVIVTWNNEEDIEECLGSIYNSFYNESVLKIETIVVDNKSSDNSIAIIENFIKANPHNVKLIKNSENAGYTKGCNQGMKIASGEFVLLLNPDTKIQKEALQKMVDFLLARDDVGAVAPQLLKKDNTVQFSCRKFPKYTDMFLEICLLSSIFSRSKFFARWKMRYFSHEELSEVEQPMGAALMIKNDLLKRINYMDERFYMFFNDIDTCKQIYNLGYKIYFNPDAKIYHKIGKSIFQQRAKMINAWNRDCLKYYRKNGYNFVYHFFLHIGLKTTGFIRVIFVKFFS